MDSDMLIYLCTQGRYEHRSKQLDPSVKLIMRMCWEHYIVGLAGFHAFVDLIAELGLGFRELQVMRIAADRRLPPLSTDFLYNSKHSHSSLSESVPDVGGFGLTRSHDRTPLGRILDFHDWEPLRRSHHVQDAVCSICFH